MIFADSGFFVALLKPRDALHPRALAWTAQVHEPVLLTEYVILEVVNRLSAAGNRGLAGQWADRVTRGSGYVVTPASTELLRRGLAMFNARPDKDWSLTDCISFVVMADKGIGRALAHDLHFQQAGFEALLRGSTGLSRPGGTRPNREGPW